MPKGAAAALKCQREEAQGHRCLCGNLLAKITPRGIELKCRKCKRLQVIPVPRTAVTPKQ
jgi:phage FluMu protein Com